MGTTSTLSSQVDHEVVLTSYQVFMGFLHVDEIKKYVQNKKQRDLFQQAGIRVAILPSLSYDSKRKAIPFDTFIKNDASIISISTSPSCAITPTLSSHPT